MNTETLNTLPAMALTAIGLLTGCADTPRNLTPREEIWRAAYCGHENMTPGDYERVHKWGEAHVKDCMLDGARDE